MNITLDMIDAAAQIAYDTAISTLNSREGCNLLARDMLKAAADAEMPTLVKYQEHAADVRATFAALTARNDRPDLKAAIDFAIGVANELQKRRESL